MYKTMYSLLLFVAVMQSAMGLECYVCKDQDTNNGKCSTTVIPCAYGEDRCLSTIKWGSTPYWDTGAPMQYYISKECATKKMCEDTIGSLMSNCIRIWWKDWNCAECCQGDRCNYYITGSESESDTREIKESESVVLTTDSTDLFEANGYFAPELGAPSTSSSVVMVVMSSIFALLLSRWH